MGYTQEELADGICSVPTLSRIENGERMPKKEHFEMLLQRLGYSDTTQDAYVDEKAFRLHELKFKIRQAVILNQIDSAKKLLDAFEQQADKSSRITQQFILLYRTLTTDAYSIEQELMQLERAIRLTCPRYKVQRLPYILSYEEIVIMNNIAVCYFERGNLEDAIDILYALKKYYENHMINAEEILRTQTMVLYNLSKYLGCAGRYDECVEICSLGIRVARETGRCNYLAWTLYNQAWALSRRNAAGDTERAKESAQLAVYMASAMGKNDTVLHFQHFIDATFFSEDH